MFVESLYHRWQVAGIRHEGCMCTDTQRIHGGCKRIYVVDRQWLQDGAALPLHIVGGKEGVALQNVGNQVPVSQHRALGHTRRAAGVLQHGEVIAVENFCAIRGFAARFQNGVQLERTGNRESRHHALHILDQEIDQCALGLRVEIGNLGDHNGLDLCAGQDRSSSLCDVGLHDHDLHIRIIELMLQLSLGVQWVGVDHHHARAQRAKAYHQILDKIRHLDRNAVAP